MDYWSILEIEPNSDEETVKKAFRKLALQYHPDKNSDPDAKDKFQKISEAYNNIMSNYTNDTNTSRYDIDEIQNLFMHSMSNVFSRKNIIKTSIELGLQELYQGHFIENFSFIMQKPTGRMIQVQQTTNWPFAFLGMSMIPETVSQECYCDVIIPKQYKTEFGPIVERIDSNTELHVYIIEKPIFGLGFTIMRENDNLRVLFDISLKESLVGFERYFIHPNGSDFIFKSNMVNPKTEKIIEEYGYTDIGHLIANFNIVFPEQIDEETRNVISKLNF